MNGVVELVQEVFGTSSVRIGIPEYMGGVVENYRNPEWSTAVGLIVANRN
jgi:cell division protein FtsA